MRLGAASRIGQSNTNFPLKIYKNEHKDRIPIKVSVCFTEKGGYFTNQFQ